MRLHFVTVPIHGSTAAEDELNQFLSSHRVIAIDRQLVADGPRSAWTICITYVDAGAGASTSVNTGMNIDAGGKKPRVDYRELLPDDEFQVFAKLRSLRKQLAERDGVPPYALFTNEQLAEMVRRHVGSIAELGQINGVGPARMEKYGRAFLDILRASPSINPPVTSAVPPVPPVSLVSAASAPSAASAAPGR